MRFRRLLHPLIIVAAALALAAAACGESPRTRSTQDSPAPVATELDRFLIRADEAPGFSPSGEPDRLSTLSAFVDEVDAAEAEERRLRDHGFQSFVGQMLDGGPEAGGVTNVFLFNTEDGARRELDYLVSNKEKDAPDGVESFERFDVPGVPSATGWTYDKPGGHKAAEVHWSQGRCVMTIGSEPPFVDQLRTGVKALYERTEGRCP